MKFIYCFLITVFSIYFSNAQVVFDLVASQESTETEAPNSFDPNKNASMILAEEHTKAAILQFQEQIRDHINYSESMTASGVEGEAVVEISISKTGMIQDTRIVKSLFKEFDKVILETLDKMEMIKFEGKEYRGARRFQLPVKFSLR